MKSVAFAALVVSAAATADATSDEKQGFIDYAARYNKTYDSVEDYNARFENFVYYDRIIKEHNDTGASFTLGHNQFSDWHPHEYEGMLSYKSSVNEKKNIKIFDESANAKAVNWVKAGGVTPVKDQLHCGSCWAFSAIGALESAHYIASGELLTFSEQQLIDCAYLRYGNLGCNGGSMDNAYKYFEDDYIMEEKAYPYTSGSTGDDSTNCLYNASEATNVTVQQYMDITPSNPSQLKAALQV